LIVGVTNNDGAIDSGESIGSSETIDGSEAINGMTAQHWPGKAAVGLSVVL
jgi:hypothetical protein